MELTAELVRVRLRVQGASGEGGARTARPSVARTRGGTQSGSNGSNGGNGDGQAATSGWGSRRSSGFASSSSTPVCLLPPKLSHFLALPSHFLRTSLRASSGRPSVFQVRGLVVVVVVSAHNRRRIGRQAQGQAKTGQVEDVGGDVGAAAGNEGRPLRARCRSRSRQDCRHGRDCWQDRRPRRSRLDGGTPRPRC